MPGGDRTGPWGSGPMTGRGAGYCSGSGVPGYRNRKIGSVRRRFGPHRFGRFFRRRPFFFGRGRW